MTSDNSVGTLLTITAAVGSAMAASFYVGRQSKSSSSWETSDTSDGPSLDMQFLRQSGKPTATGHVGVECRRLSKEEMIERSKAFYNLINQRRSLRFYSPDPVPTEVINNCILAAGTAPSGAHCQPWQFCIISTPELKQKIRTLVEAEEQVNYDRRMRKTWVKDVDHLVNDLHEGSKIVKPYLTDAPLLCVVMKQGHGVDDEGNRLENYYIEQSVGLAVGNFLSALTNAGLSTLTSTPMGAEKSIRQALGRPEHEKVYLLMPIGYPADNGSVPYRDHTTLRKPLEKISSYH